MKTDVKLEWNSKMCFKTNINGHELILDAPEEKGGDNCGPRPKPLLMASLGGCTAMDVISLLGKMRIELEGFNVRVEGEMTEEHPIMFKSMNIIYEFKGKDGIELPVDKLEKAINLSMEKYCGVSATLRKGIEITHEIKVLSK